MSCSPGSLGGEWRASAKTGADYVGEDLYELRVLRAGQRYRVLYAFHGPGLAVLLTAFAKAERRIPFREIRLARHRLDRFRDDPESRGHVEMDL